MPIRVTTEIRSLLRYRKANHIRLQLFCFPFAGAGASIFRSWIDRLPDDLEVLAVQLPGRENRFREPCVNAMEDIVQALHNDIKKSIEGPFAIFGHSLGSLIAYEVLRALTASGKNRAEVFFASGSPAPHLCSGSDTPLRFSHAQILADLQKISGPHTDLLCNPELLEMFLPVLQADFELYANYRYRDQWHLSCPIVAIRGKDDTYVEHESQLEWKRHTASTFQFHVVPGKHLFMIDSVANLLPLISRHLKPMVVGRSNDNPPGVYTA